MAHSDPASLRSSADPALLQTRRARLHLQIGWWSLLLFLSFGAVLEGLHVFAGQQYLGPAGETTRLMWRLAHVHGALLGLVHIAFGASIFMAADARLSGRAASWCLSLAGVALPLGFLLGGFFVSGGDPSPGIVLVPVGAGLLFVGVLLTARGVSALQ